MIITLIYLVVLMIVNIACNTMGVVVAMCVDGHVGSVVFAKKVDIFLIFADVFGVTFTANMVIKANHPIRCGHDHV